MKIFRYVFLASVLVSCASGGADQKSQRRCEGLTVVRSQGIITLFSGLSPLFRYDVMRHDVVRDSLYKSVIDNGARLGIPIRVLLQCDEDVAASWEKRRLNIRALVALFVNSLRVEIDPKFRTPWPSLRSDCLDWNQIPCLALDSVIDGEPYTLLYIEEWHDEVTEKWSELYDLKSR